MSTLAGRDRKFDGASNLGVSQNIKLVRGVYQIIAVILNKMAMLGTLEVVTTLNF